MGSRDLGKKRWQILFIVGGASSLGRPADGVGSSPWGCKGDHKGRPYVASLRVAKRTDNVVESSPRRFRVSASERLLLRQSIKFPASPKSPDHRPSGRRL